MRLGFNKKCLAGGLIGFLLGFLFLHPLSMVVQGLVYPTYSLKTAMLAKAFQPSHLAMAFFFGALGTLVGTCVVLLVQLVSREKERVRMLEGLLSICSYCHRVKDKDVISPDEARWTELEQYIATHSETRFTHGICPECYEKFMEKIKDKNPHTQ